jgi:hypothetical protein
MFKSEKEPAAREEFREQNRRQVELINNVFRKKRTCCALAHELLACAPSGHFVRCVGRIQGSATPLGAQTGSLFRALCYPERREASQLVTHPRTLGRSFAVRAAQDDGVVFFGNVGRNFATTTNAIPIPIRKKEKNCPRVKAFTSGASGSRKFSQMMRKIA